MKRAIDLGPVEAAAIRTSGGKVRLRLLLSQDQLEAMLMAARADDETQMKRDETHETACNAPDKTRRDDDDEDDAPARPREAVPPTAPVGRGAGVFVIEGTRAWTAWVSVGHPATLSVRREHEGRVRTGWHFPSLFPPNAMKNRENGEC